MPARVIGVEQRDAADDERHMGETRIGFGRDQEVERAQAAHAEVRDDHVRNMVLRQRNAVRGRMRAQKSDAAGSKEPLERVEVGVAAVDRKREWKGPCRRRLV